MLPLVRYRFQVERPEEISGCPTLVPEAACGSELSVSLGTCGWLCVERLSLGSLLREASLERCFLPEIAGVLGEVSGCPVLVPEVTCRPELTTLAQGLGAGSVQKGSHWGACSKKLEKRPCGRSPLPE